MKGIYLSRNLKLIPCSRDLTDGDFKVLQQNGSISLYVEWRDLEPGLRERQTARIELLLSAFQPFVQ